MLILYLSSFMFFSGMLSLVLSRKHLLLVLLSLEFIVLSLFLMLINYFSMNYLEAFISMVFLTFSVCEGALGLSLLVSLIRTHGNDYIKSLVTLW
uniref:NADH-ubiquinone oxidoreductase chain 4L n=1 Tax=Elateroides dermestoides TaxID=295947 RepID=E3VTD5_9CUCU|nr:NADH dehydrogenase subunit 4L [Elateroides dermestoides]